MPNLNRQIVITVLPKQVLFDLNSCTFGKFNITCREIAGESSQSIYRKMEKNMC